jgi:Ca2+-binding RTX toxin-like protein
MSNLVKALPLFAGMVLFTGCATQTRTVTTETTYEPAPVSATAQTTTRTTTESQTETQQEGGLLSGTVDIVGKTIALPFRVVGGLVDLIF